MRVLVLGMNFSKASYERTTSYPRLFGWVEKLGLGIVSFDNVSDQLKFYVSKERQSYIQQITEGYDRVISLGVDADKVLEKLSIPHFAMPHPSGLNRKLNDPHYVDGCLNKCKEYLWKN